MFYNTTRKLVLKGVDGVVFVADSQRAMLHANQESFRNLEENLAEMGLSVETLPVVLQFNKRDLPDICSVDDLNRALNRGNWPWFEASALTGQGVFETLKGISKLTLLSLKKRLTRPEAVSPAAGRAAATATSPPTAARPSAPPSPPPVAAARLAAIAVPTRAAGPDARPHRQAVGRRAGRAREAPPRGPEAGDWCGRRGGAGRGPRGSGGTGGGHQYAAQRQRRAVAATSS